MAYHEQHGIVSSNRASGWIRTTCLRLNRGMNFKIRLHNLLFLLAAAFFYLAAPLALAEQKPAATGQFLGAKSTEYPAWFKESFLDFNEDLKEAAANGKRLLILFHQEGCPYCNLLVERNLSQKGIETFMQKHFEVIAINMWGDREIATIDDKHLTEKQFAEALKVQFTPTLVFLDEEGKQVLRLNGYMPPERFMLALQYGNGQGASGQSFRQFMHQRAPVKSTGKLIAEDFFITGPINLQSLDQSRPFAVFFEQKDCPACKTLHEKILGDEETRKLVAGFNSIQLDMWGKTEMTLFDGKKISARDWARKLGIHYAPTIVLFNPEGSEIIRSEAMFKTFHAQSIFDYVLSGAYKSQPNFQRFLEARADTIRKQSKDVDIWK